MARFAYYDRLSDASKRTYRKSDAITRVEVPNLDALRPAALSLEPALAQAKRTAVERACQSIVDGVNGRLQAPPVVVRVLERRP